MTTQPSSDARDARRRKSVLTCPECGHESTTTGDWVVRERNGRIDYDCPDCGTTITTRGTLESARQNDCRGIETPADD